MPILKALASYFLFASYVHLYQPLTKRCSGCAVLKHESREWVKGKESKRLRVQETKSQKDKEAKGPFFET